MNSRLLQIGGIFCLICASFYLVSELFCVLFCAAPAEGYLFHTISELGVPIGSAFEGEISSFSPLYQWMNVALILSGLTFPLCSFFCLSAEKTDGKKIFLLSLSVLTGLGITGVGIFHPVGISLFSLHNLFAFTCFLGGNLFLLLTGVFYRGSTLYRTAFGLGIAGLISTWIMFLATVVRQDAVQAIFERISVYTLVLFEILGGIRLLHRQST